MGLLKTQERLTGRAIPFAMLFTQTSPALRPKTQRFIEKRLADEGAPVFEVQLVDREAYRAMLSFGGTVAGLAGKGVRGLPAAVANAHAGLKMGVTQFDSTVGGLGGCPFAGQPKAAGNICSEELVLLCEEMGIDTGVDLDALIEVGRMAEEIVGHQLPGELIHAGSLDAFRRRAAA